MKKGFTLVELLIVLAVIAALMAVATPMALNAVKTAKASQVAQNLNALKSAIEQYSYTEKKVPTTIDNLANYLSNYSTIKDSYVIKYWKSNVGADNFDTSGVATVVVLYKNGDADPEAVAKQNNLTSPISTGQNGVGNTNNYGGDALPSNPPSTLPGATVTVAKWW